MQPGLSLLEAANSNGINEDDANPLLTTNRRKLFVLYEILAIPLSSMI